MKKPMKTDHYGQVMTNPDGSTMREDVITGAVKEPPSSGSERRLVRRCVSHHFACDCREDAFAKLLKDVMQLHSDPNGAQYNECDTDPCAWCEEAKRLMFHGHPDPPNETSPFVGANEK